MLAALLGVPQIILDLMIEPAFRRRAERHRQTQRHFRADARPAIQNAGQGFPADAQSFRCLGNG